MCLANVTNLINWGLEIILDMSWISLTSALFYSIWIWNYLKSIDNAILFDKALFHSFKYLQRNGLRNLKCIVKSEEIQKTSPGDQIYWGSWSRRLQAVGSLLSINHFLVCFLLMLLYIQNYIYKWSSSDRLFLLI